MPHPKAFRLPEPVNDADFEVLCVELFEAWKKPRTAPERFGRSGQKQHGLDFILDLEDGLHGYQCKCTRSIDRAIVEEELEKTAAFPAPLSAFTVLTTAARDARLQEQVLALSTARRGRGDFPVGIMFWETICERLGGYPELLKQHFADLVPDLDDLLAARARRLDEEFPGTTLTYLTAPGRTTVTVHPGPGGVPMKATMYGKEVFERFEQSMHTGKPVTFTQEEFNLVLPDAIAQVLGRPAPGEGGRGRFTITPSINGSKERARLLIQPTSAYHSVEIFERKGRRSAEGLPATITVIEGGTERMRVRVEVEGLPLALMIEGGGSRRGTYRTERSYLGEPVGLALAMERHLQQLNAGAYVGVYGETVQFAFRTEPRTPAVALLKMLEALGELADLTDWEINVPEEVTEEDATTGNALVELFKHGRRVVGRGGTVDVVFETDEQLQRLRDLLTGDTTNLSTTLDEEEREIQLIGQTFRLPAIRTIIPRIQIADHDAARILAGVGPPVEMDVLIPDDVDVVEELVETEALP